MVLLYLAYIRFLREGVQMLNIKSWLVRHRGARNAVMLVLVCVFGGVGIASVVLMSHERLSTLLSERGWEMSENFELYSLSEVEGFQGEFSGSLIGISGSIESGFTLKLALQNQQNEVIVAEFPYDNVVFRFNNDADPVARFSRFKDADLSPGQQNISTSKLIQGHTRELTLVLPEEVFQKEVASQLQSTP